MTRCCIGHGEATRLCEVCGAPVCPKCPPHGGRDGGPKEGR